MVGLEDVRTADQARRMTGRPWIAPDVREPRRGTQPLGEPSKDQGAPDVSAANDGATLPGHGSLDGVELRLW